MEIHEHYILYMIILYNYTFIINISMDQKFGLTGHTKH